MFLTKLGQYLGQKVFYAVCLEGTLYQSFTVSVFFCDFKTIGCRPAASVDHFTSDTLGYADLVEEQAAGDSRVVKVKKKRLLQ